MSLHSCIRWLKNHPVKTLLLLFTVLSGLIVTTVVPPVCLINGCPPKSSPQQYMNGTNRLIINFADVSKSIRSITPRVLWEYFDEYGLDVSGIKVVSFADSSVMAEIRRMIESETDLLNILEDEALVTPPLGDVLTSDGSHRRKILQDPFIHQQWHLPRVNATNAWNTTSGTNTVVVAVIDTGCDLNHPDLKDNIWINVEEIPGNGIDDDQNGYIDDVYGYDFAGDCRTDWRSSTNPSTGTKCGGKPLPQDVHSHGTHCAGIIAAVNGNRIGVSGIAPRVKIMCLKVSDPDGTFYTSHILRAYDYALKMGAHVASCSFGPAEPRMNPTENQKAAMFNETRFYEQALLPMKIKGMLIVSAAGNENTNLNLLPANSSYNPCTSGQNPKIQNAMLCVMATNLQDNRWSETLSNNQPVGSNYGSTVVDIGAPGREILSTIPGAEQYGNKTGSSMATPLTAGIAALILSVLGSNNSHYYQGALARSILIETCDRPLSMANVVRYKGLVNAANAVQAALGHVMNVYTLLPSQAPDLGAVQMEGFSEVYYAGALLSLDEQQWDMLSVLDISARSGVSSFSAFKHGQNSTLLLNSTFYAPTPGLYGMRISGHPRPDDVVMKIGFRTLPVLNTIQTLTLHVREAGAYLFELRYRNPREPVEFKMSLPESFSQFTYLNAYFKTVQTAIRTISFAPNANLSNVFQALYSPGMMVSSSIHNLSMNMHHRYTSVVEDVAFLTLGSLAAACPLDKNASGMPGVSGIFHTRLRSPAEPVVFVLSCQKCSLSLNGLLLVDVGSREMVTMTRNSGCVTIPSTSMHELTVRFTTQDIQSAVLHMQWSLCGSPRLIGSLKTHIDNPLFWKPNDANTMVGYIGGMQCDVWPATPAMTSTSSPPPSTLPILKFRLPSVLASSKSLTSVAVINPLWHVHGCKPTAGKLAYETFNRACNTSFNFFLRDVYNGFPLSPTQLYGQLMQNVYMRCWTYIRRGIVDGVITTRSTFPTYSITLGAQTIFAIVPASESNPNNGISIAPNTSTLNGYYQLLTFEARNVGGNVLIGIMEGHQRNAFPVDYSNTLLPLIPSLSTNRLSKHMVMSLFDPVGEYDTQLGFGNFTVYHIGYKTLANVSSSLMSGLSGVVKFPTSTTSRVKGRARYMHSVGFIQSSHQRRLMTLRIQAGTSQTTVLTINNITIMNGNEFTATTVTSAEIQIMFPGGYVPARITIRSNSQANEAILNISDVGPLGPSWAMWFSESNRKK